MANIQELEKKFAKIRNDFPMLQKVVNDHPFVYLDSAATAQKPDCVIDSITNFYRDQYGTVHRAVYSTAAWASEAYQKVRERIAKFLNASIADEIIFTRGTTSAINLAVSSFGKAFIKKGDEVLITEMEHHSNIVPWQIMADALGAKLQVVPFLDNGELDMEAFKKLLSHKTKLVGVAHVSNALGTINPVKEIIKLAHAVGAKVLVDAAQSVPHMPVDVQDLDCDFLAFSGHKLVGPTGVGVLFGKLDLLNSIPPFEGGGDMIETVTFPKTTYNVPPLKFEAGTPMIAEVIALGAAIDYVSSIGLTDIFSWEHHLLSYLQPRMEEIQGLKVLGKAKNKSGIVTFSIDGIHPLDIATMLDLRGIAVRSGHLCAQPVMRHYGITASARASLGFYNNIQDLDRFLEALKQVVTILR